MCGRVENLPVGKFDKVFFVMSLSHFPGHDLTSNLHGYILLSLVMNIRKPYLSVSL